MNLAFLTTEGGALGSNVTFLAVIAVFGVVMYLFMYRPQKKKEKQATDLRNSIEVGDEVTTIGGIVGRVVSLKEDTFVLETAGDRSRMRFKRWAIQDVGKLDLEGSSSATATPEAAAQPKSWAERRAEKKAEKEKNKE